MSTDATAPSVSRLFAFGLLVALGLIVGAVAGFVIGLFTGLVPFSC
jgi:hypothetical protein